MDYKIRKMKRSDCADVTHVVTVAWNETYRGIVDDSILDDLYKNEDERTNRSISRFDDNNNHSFVLEVNDKIVCFINVGSADDEEFPNCGEIYAIYIISEYKGQGYGRKLISEGINELKNMGFNKMIISCLQGNKTNDFYKHIGGKFIKTRIFKKLQLPENVYYFENI